MGEGAASERTRGCVAWKEEHVGLSKSLLPLKHDFEQVQSNIKTLQSIDEKGLHATQGQVPVNICGREHNIKINRSAFEVWGEDTSNALSNTCPCPEVDSPRVILEICGQYLSFFSTKNWGITELKSPDQQGTGSTGWWLGKIGVLGGHCG